MKPCVWYVKCKCELLVTMSRVLQVRYKRLSPLSSCIHGLSPQWATGRTSSALGAGGSIVTPGNRQGNICMYIADLILNVHMTIE